MQQFDIPGVGLALIDGGKVVFEGGLGVKALGKPDPVDADTLLHGRLRHQGDDDAAAGRTGRRSAGCAGIEPVADLYPDFRLGNAATTRQVLVKHLVCACTGLPRQDFEWLFNFAEATPVSSLGLLATMQPTSRFGEVFQYSNLMAGAAGYVAASLVNPKQEFGAAYDAAMQSEVFAPLGMTHTTFDFAAAHGRQLRRPARRGRGRARPLPRSAWTATTRSCRSGPRAACGPACATCRNTSRWSWRWAGCPTARQLVSRENLLERRRPQVQDRRGRQLRHGAGDRHALRHSRDQPRRRHVRLQERHDLPARPWRRRGDPDRTPIPDGYLSGLLRRRLLEVLFDGRPEAVEQPKAAQRAQTARLAAPRRRERLVVPAGCARRPASSRTRYASPALGTLGVRSRDGVTTFDFAKWSSAVASRHNDDGTTSYITIDPTVDGFNFVRGERDGKKALIIRDAQHEYAFIETP